MKNSIYLRRKMKLLVEDGSSTVSNNYVATALKNIESLGFTFSETLIEQLRTLSIVQLSTFYKRLIKDLKAMTGSHVEFNPMYPNFPEQVMDASDAELYINAIVHYTGSFVRDVTGAEVTVSSLPQYEKEERFPLLGRIDLKVIDLGSEEELVGMISNLIGSKTSISQTDREDIEWFIRNYESLDMILPAEIPMKENLAFTVGLLLTCGKASASEVKHYFKTATDVLRLAVSLSDGDVSLATNTHFRKFKRAERRFFLGLLDNCKDATEDMLRFKQQWIRLGEILHPGEYKKRYAKANESFRILRNNVKFETFNGKVETSLVNGDVAQAISLLSTRPGDFARRLDHLLRIKEGSYALLVISAFEKVSHEVSTPVLLQLFAHFKHRNEKKEVKVVFPKGNVANVTALDKEVPVVSEKFNKAIVALVEDTLVARFAELPSLGKVEIDEKLKNYIVPFSQRSASKAFRTIVRGSQVDLPEGDTIRFFLWWKEGVVNGLNTGRVDIDLSAAFYDEKWGFMNHVSYTELRSEKFRAFHSGDITSAPDGAAEFIDIDIPSFVNNGGRYLVMNLYSFTDQPFSNLPECFAGWMTRQEPGSGEVFEPSTVEQKFDVTANTRICVPVIFDLVERKAIWTDLSLTRELDEYPNNIENAKGSVALMGKAMTNLVKPNLYDLFYLHSKARGELEFTLEEDEEVDTVFSVNKGITPLDIETIMGDFIA
jgi:hypothetical protein